MEKLNSEQFLQFLISNKQERETASYILATQFGVIVQEK